MTRSPEMGSRSISSAMNGVRLQRRQNGSQSSFRNMLRLGYRTNVAVADLRGRLLSSRGIVASARSLCDGRRRFGRRSAALASAQTQRPGSAEPGRAARRAHSSRAIVPTVPERTSATATPRSCRSSAPRERFATTAITWSWSTTSLLVVRGSHRPEQPQDACWLGLDPTLGKRRRLPLAPRSEASTIAPASLPPWNGREALGLRCSRSRSARRIRPCVPFVSGPDRASGHIPAATRRRAVRRSIETTRTSCSRRSTPHIRTRHRTASAPWRDHLRRLRNNHAACSCTRAR